jgi:hypothetical protein
MNWFNRHLNWSWILATVVINVVVVIASDSYAISKFALLAIIPVTIWVLSQKGQSVWWVFLSWVAAPLWLKNRYQENSHSVVENNILEKQQEAEDEETRPAIVPFQEVLVVKPVVVKPVIEISQEKNKPKEIIPVVLIGLFILGLVIFLVLIKE